MKGKKLELLYSQMIHSKGLPLLLSPLVLHSRGMGQIDMAHIFSKGNKKYIRIFEIKSSSFLGHKQKIRLRRTGNFLGTLLNLPIFITFISGKKRKAL